MLMSTGCEDFRFADVVNVALQLEPFQTVLIRITVTCNT